MMFYRADMLEKYDVEAPDPLSGWSFDQLEAACRQLKTALANDGMDQTWPLVLLLAGAGTVHYNFAASMGTPLYDADSLPQYNTPESIAALELIKGWMDEGLISPGALGYNYPEGIETLRQEQTVIALQWDTAAVELTDPGASPTTADTLDFSVHPGTPTSGIMRHGSGPAYGRISYRNSAKTRKPPSRTLRGTHRRKSLTTMFGTEVDTRDVSLC